MLRLARLGRRILSVMIALLERWMKLCVGDLQRLLYPQKDAENTELCALFSHLDGVLISQHKASEAKRRKG